MARQLSPEEFQKMSALAIDLRSRGWSWDNIGHQLGVARSTARCIADPKYRAQRLAAVQRNNDARKAGKAAIAITAKRSTDIDAEHLRQSIPAVEKRSLTGQLFGDPPPGRSALDMERGAHCFAIDE